MYIPELQSTDPAAHMLWNFISCGVTAVSVTYICKLNNNLCLRLKVLCSQGHQKEHRSSQCTSSVTSLVSAKHTSGEEREREIKKQRVRNKETKAVRKDKDEKEQQREGRNEKGKNEIYK
jgi:putative protein kinase ArgK-like GTPase of G3E family